MIIRLSQLFNEFFESEKTGGLILLFCTATSLFIANSSLGDYYLHFWHRHLDLSFLSIHLNYRIEQWINDGLMTVFFLLVGLEIERELYAGELSDIRNALLPIVAALGGMMIPALFYLSFNLGTPAQSGFGIPMATDIAFSLGVLSLLGNRIPASLKIFLTALAIIDDLGAIIIIAFFYAGNFSLIHFILAVTVFIVLLTLNRLKVSKLVFYLLPGLAMWYFMHESGVHATITGVLLAFAMPFGKNDKLSPSFRMQQYLHKPVPFLILPIFALANTGIIFSSQWYLGYTLNSNIGILAGLLIGKPLGILFFSFIGVKTGICKLPEDLKWRHLGGVGILAGIGFTMSIFMANLAFTDDALMKNAKMAILSASAIAGVSGLLFLSRMGKSDVPDKAKK